MLSVPYDCTEVMLQPTKGYVFNESILDTWPAPHPHGTPQQLAFLQEDAERKPKNSTKLLPMSFRIGDIGALDAFFKTRLNELGRRNVGKILPSWIEQMYPSRKQYGSYGTKYMPPWWPHEVPYESPSHLKASGKQQDHLYFLRSRLQFFSSFYTSCRPFTTASAERLVQT
jgi:hypothetical protein